MVKGLGVSGCRVKKLRVSVSMYVACIVIDPL